MTTSKKRRSNAVLTMIREISVTMVTIQLQLRLLNFKIHILVSFFRMHVQVMILLIMTRIQNQEIRTQIIGMVEIFSFV